MGPIEAIAAWLREIMATQRWLAPIRHYVERTPDWMLVAAPVLLLILLVVIFWPRKQRACEPNLHNWEQSSHPPVRSGADAHTASPKPSGAAKPAPLAAGEDDNRTVRVFVSSTFLDMQRERDVLVRQTFPALRAKFRARGVELFEVDLRWGITQEQSENGQTLPTLLAEIDRCRPYFIGLLGERYGSVLPENALTNELKAAYPSIATAAGRSITEMEIIHGVLRNPDAAKRAIFFERDPAWLETLSAEERASYLADNEEGRAKLADLKARIRASGARVIPYAKPEDIGPAVEGALVEGIEAQFPEADAPDAFTQTARLHTAYARERRGTHIGAERYISALDAWFAQTDAGPMLITGASGGGKSALIANWLTHHRSNAPNDIVFEHYLGASPDSGDPILIVRRLWAHLDRMTGETVQQPADARELVDGLSQRLAATSAYARRHRLNVIIALDGLDKLSDQADLRWLPAFLPSRVRLVASTLAGPAQDAAKARSFETVEVLPLDIAERQQFVDTTLASWGRALSRRRIERIASFPLSASPIFLKTLLGEMRVANVEAKLDPMLEKYLGVTDIPGLFDLILERLEADFSRTLVATALSLIWGGRSGLTENEILEIGNVFPLQWATLRNSLAEGLRDQGGRVAFSHDFLRAAVEFRYLACDDAKTKNHLAIADYFESRPPDERQVEELPYQLRAARELKRLRNLLEDLDRFSLLRSRGDGELLGYWLPLKAEGVEPEERLCDLFFERAGPSHQWHDPELLGLASEICEFFHFAGLHGEAAVRLETSRALVAQRIFGDDDPLALSDMLRLASIRFASGDWGGALTLQDTVLQVRARTLGENHPDTLSCMNARAITLRALGEVETASRIFKQVWKKQSRLLGDGHPATLATMSNLAGAMKELGDLKGAQRLQERVVAVHRLMFGPESTTTLTSASNLAVTLTLQGKHAEAKDMLDRIVEARRRLLGAEHPSTLSSMTNLAQLFHALGEMKLAIAVQRETLEIQQRTLGDEHPSTLLSMNNLAGSLHKDGDLWGSMTLLRTVLETHARLHGREHPATKRSLMNLAAVLLDLVGRGDLALADAKQALSLPPDAVIVDRSEYHASARNYGRLEYE